MRTAKTLIRLDAQADLSLRWAHSHFVGYVMSRLKCLTSLCNEAIVILYRSFINDI